MTTLRFIGASMACALLCGALNAQDLAQRIISAATTIRNDNDLTGVVLSVREDGAPVAEAAIGDSITGIPATTDMHFRGGGVQINVLVNVLLQAVDEELITLDDTLDQWMPDVPNADAITLRMLANCTAGIADYVFVPAFEDAFYGNVFRSFTPQELIDYAMPTSPEFAPGTDWHYSHTNFVILGVILEDIYNMDFGDIVRTKVYEPLRLTGTYFVRNAWIPEPVLHAFTTERGIFEDSTFWNPSWTSYSSSLVTTIPDVDKLANGLFTTQLISQSSLDAMLAPDTAGLGPNTTERYYGMGIGVLGDWLLQNPSFGGHQGVMAYNRANGDSIAVFDSLGLTSDPDTHYGMILYQTIQAELDTIVAPDVTLDSLSYGVRASWQSKTGLKYQVETADDLETFSSSGLPNYNGTGAELQYYHIWPNGTQEAPFFLRLLVDEQ